MFISCTVFTSGNIETSPMSGSCRSVLNKRQRTPKGQSKMDNPEKMATQGIQDEDKQNKNTTHYLLDTT